MLSPTEGENFTNSYKDYFIEGNWMPLTFRIGYFLENASIDLFYLTANFTIDNKDEKIIREAVSKEGNHYTFTYLRTGIPHVSPINVSGLENGFHELSITAHLVYDYEDSLRVIRANQSFPPIHFYVYNYPPTPKSLRLLSPQNKTYNSTDVPLSIEIINPEGSGGEYSVQYSLDNQTNQTYVYNDINSSQKILLNTTLRNVSDGSHQIFICNSIGTDAVLFTVDAPIGNVSDWIPYAVVALVIALGVAALICFAKRRKVL
jgi:hypothetical protein